MTVVAGALVELASAPVTIDAAASLADAARRMGAAHVGSLVVVEAGEPVGLVTDRDVALAGCLGAQGTAAPRVGAIASRPLVTLPTSAGLDAFTALCAARCIRRVGLVDGGGTLVGVVSTDTVIQHVVRQLGDLARTLERELAEERAPTAGPHRTFGFE